MARFIFVRHGQSETNITNTFAGQNDPPLTEKGERQAALLSAWLVNAYTIDAVYASDLQRAYRTAEIATERIAKDVVKTTAFREINAGDWQGKTYAEIREMYQKEHAVWLNDTANAALPNGETVKEMAKRVMAELYRLNDLHGDETVAVFTHATPIRALIAQLQHGTIEAMNDISFVPNASATVFRLENRRAVFEVIGYADYLQDEKTSIPQGII